METRPNVFADLEARAWPNAFTVELHIESIAGGIPSDPDIAESWIRSKMEVDDQALRTLVMTTMSERNITYDQAVAEVNQLKHTNGFYRDSAQGLWIAGRNVKAAIKEAVSVAVASPTGKLPVRGWGTTRKFLTNYVPEHVFVPERRVPLLHASDGENAQGQAFTAGDQFHEPTRIAQSFPMNTRIHQTGIQRTEVCDDVLVRFTVLSDHPFTRDEWGMIWLTGKFQGLGAQRSQGYGVYEITRWDQFRGTMPARSSNGSSNAAEPAADAEPAAAEAAGSGDED